jgi:Fuc2NAc and GlcNAc transferase
MSWATISFVLAGFLLSCWLTSVARRLAIRARLLDHPNERSSHSRPTPRGGGVAFVGAFVLLTLGMGQMGYVEPALQLALVGAGLVVATIGLIDDRAHLPARLRLLGHAAAAGWVLWWMGHIPPVPLLGIRVNLGVAGVVLCGLYIVWMINLFNFMDGIDGIASVEAVTAALGGAFVWWLAGSGSQWSVAILFAACVAGFLVWNFPPARIFMGDAGSGFLGLVVAVLSLWCGREVPHLFWSWFILIGSFMVDATTTLVRRVRRGDRFDEAHRSHAYQFAARKFGSHTRVALAFGLVNVLWLLPLAVLVALRHIDGVVGVVLAYGPLVWVAFRLKAGDRAAQQV